MKSIRLLLLVMLIGGICMVSGCKSLEGFNDSVENTNTSNEILSSSTQLNNTNVEEKACNLKWRIQTDNSGEIIKSYLYLYSENNEKIECEVGYIEGEVFSLEEYKDRYPKDGVIPINSWYGGQGIEIVGRYIDKSTLMLMSKGIGDGIEYGTSWDQYDEWYRINISYNEQGEIENLEAIELMSLYMDSEEANKEVSINSFIGTWEIASVAWEPKQHNYIGIMDQIIGTTVILKEDYYECGDDIVSESSLELEKIDSNHFLFAYAAGAQDVVMQYEEMYALAIKKEDVAITYLYYMDGEIWSDYKGLLFRLEKID